MLRGKRAWGYPLDSESNTDICTATHRGAEAISELIGRCDRSRKELAWATGASRIHPHAEPAFGFPRERPVIAAIRETSREGIMRSTGGQLEADYLDGRQGRLIDARINPNFQITRCRSCAINFACDLEGRRPIWSPIGDPPNYPFGERQQKSHLTPPTKQPGESKCGHSQMRAKLHPLTTHLFARTQRGVTSMRIPELSQLRPSRNMKSSLSIQRQLVRRVS